MKRQVFTLLTAGVLCTSLTGGAFASSSAADAEKDKVVSQLEKRAQRLEQHAQGTKGGGRQEFEIQRHQIQDLIGRIKAGEAVDPQELDKLLRQGVQ